MKAIDLSHRFQKKTLSIGSPRWPYGSFHFYTTFFFFFVLFLTFFKPVRYGLLNTVGPRGLNYTLFFFFITEIWRCICIMHVMDGPGVFSCCFFFFRMRLVSVFICGRNYAKLVNPRKCFCKAIAELLPTKIKERVR